MIVWGAACGNIGAEEAYDWWRGYPIYGALMAAAPWHVALVALEGERHHYVMYALGHLPVLAVVALVSLIHATRAPL